MSSNSKSELITLLLDEKKNIDVILNNLPEQTMETKIVNNNQSVKEIITHITYWDIQGTKWIRDIINNKNPDMPWSESISIKELRRIQAKLNYEMNEKNKIKPLSNVLEDFSQAFMILLKTINELTEDQFNRTFKFKWTDKSYSTQEIILWRVNHMKTHANHIKDWLKENMQ